MATNRIFDDFAKLVTDATGAAQGVRREIETAVKAQIERILRDMDVATREEVEVLRDMVTSMRAENDALRTRVAEIEGRRARKGGAAAAIPAEAAPEVPPGN